MNGIPSLFMPYIPETIVGIVIIRVIEVKTFITIFKLLEIMEAKASIVLERIFI